MLAPERPHRVYRMRELPAFVGIKASQIAELVKTGEFPAPIPLTDHGRACAWLESDLVRWQQERIAKRDIRVASSVENRAEAARIAAEKAASA